MVTFNPSQQVVDVDMTGGKDEFPGSGSELSMQRPEIRV